MKLLLILSFFFCVNIANAKDYYISATGNDANNGLTSATPWKTISKLNSFFNNLVAGDNIYFKRGDIFYGCIVITKSGVSGNLITIGAYGSGNKPVISGLITLASWSAVGGGIYQSAAPSVKNSVNLVTINGLPQAVGRYPNADAANGGYLTYESYSGLSSITDNQLTGATNWTGAEVVIRKQHWVVEKCKITSHVNTIINYTTTPNINPASNSTSTIYSGTNGYGYFIQRDSRTLDKLGEWYFNPSTKYMQMYFGSNNPSSYNIQVSTLDTLVNIGSQKYLNINNISFEGANLIAIYAQNSSGLTFQSCDFNLMGAKGILINASSNILIDGITSNNALCNAIDLNARYVGNATVRNCIIKNTGLLVGMGSFWDPNDYKAIGVGASSGVLIEYNSVVNTGYNGIDFQGNNVMVKNNFVNNYAFVKDDGGGIYTYANGSDAAPGTTYTNRTIKENIILNGIGAPNGAGGGIDVDGIFLDGRSMNVDVLNNTVANVGNNGIYSNNATNVNIRGNTSFNNGSALGLTRYSWGSISNLSIKQNIFYPKYNTQSNFLYINTGVNVPVTSTIQAAMQGIGNIDSNYIATPYATGFGYYYSLTEGGTWVFPKPMSFGGWKSFTNHDLTSKEIPKIPSYKLNNTIGANLVTNGDFASNITGIAIVAGNNTSIWDNTGKITGPGSLRITPTTSSTNFTNISGTIGAVSSSKKYILRFTTLGTTSNGILKAHIRKTGSPYTILATEQLENFGTTKVVHEFLFNAPTTDAAASFVIEISQSSGTTYVDDIAFYEADATVLNIDDQLKFEYNETNVAKTITLDASYTGVDNKVYNGSITLQPYTSAILVKTGSVTTTLKADAGTDISLVLPTNSTVLKGSAIGNITGYSWTKISGPSQFTIANPGSPSTAISNLAMGKYTFQFKVISSTGDSAMATVNVVMLGVLPVTLVDFTAKNNDDKIALQWKVASEINVSHYTIERSGNAQTFESIGEVSATNLFTAQSYDYNDNFPLQGVNYYRLVMVDKDGTTKYSKTISVNDNNISSFKLNKLTLSANNNNLKIAINSNQQQVMQVVLADVSGRIIYANTIQLQKGVNAIDKKMPALNTGVYYAKLFTSDQVITKTLLSEQ